MTWVGYCNYWGMETLFGDAGKWVFGTRGGLAYLLAREELPYFKFVARLVDGI